MIILFFTVSQHQLTFVKLIDNMQTLPTAAAWVENEWGYIRNKGIEFRKEMLTGLANYTYIAMLNHQPVAMFVLIPYEFCAELRGRTNRLPKMNELMCVYVDKDYQGLGFGRQIINKAKKVAREQNADFVLLDTLKPSLNSMYKKHGAEVVCENHLYSHSTDVLTIRV